MQTAIALSRLLRQMAERQRQQHSQVADPRLAGNLARLSDQPAPTAPQGTPR
ncbi:MAG: hypothetical protein NTW01_17350 [Gammaproteobacteria bacterium]|nr:hypothetical protein [Gammaproteobacteria bacterium]